MPRRIPGDTIAVLFFDMPGRGPRARARENRSTSTTIASGRLSFNRPDPFSGNTFDPQSLHKYAYAYDDPVNGIDPSGRETFSILDRLNTLSLEATLFVMHTVPMRAAIVFARGGPAIGAFLKSFEVIVNNYARQVIGLVPQLQYLPTRLAGVTRVPDFVLRFSNMTRIVEAKYQLPLSGPAFTRFMSQLTQFTEYASTRANYQVVVWTLKDVTRWPEFAKNAAAVGVDISSVQFVHGVRGLYQYFRFWIGM